MNRARNEHGRWIRIAGAMAMLSRCGLGQAPDAPMVDVIDARDSLLAEYGLLGPLAAGLRQRITEASGDERERLIDGLGRLYAKMLSSAGTTQERREIEDRAKDLLKVAPETQSLGLRLTLAAAEYLPIEEVAERRLMRLSKPEEDAETLRVLRSVKPVFTDIALKLAARMNSLRERKDRGVFANEAMAERNTAELAEVSEQHAQARYYAGWCAYYEALLSGDKHGAVDAMEGFGAILGAVAGKPATLERLPESALRLAPGARAVLGCAMASSLLGNHVEAERWLDALEHAEDVPAEVMAQFVRRKLMVLASADRWAEVKVAVMRARRPNPSDQPGPMVVADARMLCVLCLDALGRSDLRPGLRSTVEELAQLGLGDLVARGEAGHVLDLVNLYGTALIGRDGFINNYVRGLRSFDDVRRLHKAEGGNPEEPTKTPALIDQYHQAAKLFEATIAAEDAKGFPSELARTHICRGLALFYAGSLERAADAFEQGFEAGVTEAQKRDALWYAVVCLDRAVREGKPSVGERRERLATLYIKSFPDSDNAVSLLLERVRGGAGGDQRDVESLLKVPESSGMYIAARRVAARLLYTQYKRAVGDEKDFAALRFTGVVEEVLKSEFAKATSERTDATRRTAEDALVHARQLVDALLATKAPDVARAEAAMSLIDSLGVYQGLDLRNLEPELAYHRLRIAWARNDESGAQRQMERLRAAGGPYVAVAERTLYKRAIEDLGKAPQDTGAAKRVVTTGSRVLLDTGLSADVLAGVRERVADAAFSVWSLEKDQAMRDVCVRTDEAQLQSGRRTGSSLRRLALLREAMGDREAALSHWNELLSGLPESSSEWYEARYESIRLMAQTSPTDAAIALKQHQVLHPSWGPAPWDAKFAELKNKVGEPPAPTPGGQK